MSRSAHDCNHAIAAPASHAWSCNHSADCACRGVMCPEIEGRSRGPEIRDELTIRMLDWRGVDDPCLQCGGSGRRSYSNGSTWRGGVGAASITPDVCDRCWGTGDRYRHGVNLRQLRDEEQTRIAKAALTAVVDSVGVEMRGGHVAIVLRELDNLLDRRRNPMDVFAASTLLGLRNLIARALGVQERRL